MKLTVLSGTGVAAALVPAFMSWFTLMTGAADSAIRRAVSCIGLLGETICLKSDLQGSDRGNRRGNRHLAHERPEAIPDIGSRTHRHGRLIQCRLGLDDSRGCVGLLRIDSQSFKRQIPYEPGDAAGACSRDCELGV